MIALLLGLALAADPVDRSAPPAVTPPPPPPWPLPSLHALSDGTPVWVIERHDSPLVRVELSLLRGSADQADPLAAAMAQSLLDRGTTQQEAAAWLDALDAHGAQAEVGMGALRAWADVEALSTDVEAPLRLTAAAFLHPAFDRSELRRRRREWREGGAEAWRSASSVMDAALTRAVYPPDHPLGRRDIPRDYRRLRHRRVAQAWEAVLAEGQPAIVVIGDTTPAAILPTLEAVWAGQLPGKAHGAPLPAPPPTGPRLILVDEPGTSQTLLGLSLPGLPVDHPQAAAQALAVQVLGGSFTSRLNQELREDKGYTYGADAWIDAWPGHSRIRAATSVDTAKAAPALAALLGQLDRMAADPPSPAELDAARNALYVSGARDLDDIGDTAYPYGLAQAYGAGPDHPAAQAAALAGVDAAAVAALCPPLFGPAQRVIVVVGDRALLEPALEAAHLDVTTIWDRKRLILER